MSTRLTQRELRAIDEALAFRLAGDIEPDLLEADGTSYADYESAQQKIQARIKD